MTAEDVRWSFERLLSPATRSQRRWVLEPISGIRVADGGVIELTLKRATPGFLTHLALEAASVLPREVYEDPDAGYLRHPVGAGPFAFESWLPGERISLVRAEDPARQTGGRARRVIYRIIASEATALQEYLAGGLDVLDEIPAGSRRRLAEGLGAQFRRTPQPAVAYLGFNHGAAPFAGNRALRQALNYAVDKRFICDAIGEGKDLPAAGIIPPGVPGHDPSLEGYPFDPERARALLARAGYPEGRGLPGIVLHYNTSETQRRIMERVQIDLARVGVRTRLKNLDPPALLQALAGGEAICFRMAWLAESPDTDAFLSPVIHSAGGPDEGNFARYAHPEVDRLIDRARVTVDPVERVALYRRAQRIAVEDACWLFLYFYRDEALVSPRLSGLRLPALGDFLAPLDEVALDPEAVAPAR